MNSDPPRLEDALAAFQAALASRPGNHMVISNIGQVRNLLGEYDRAAAIFSQELKQGQAYMMNHIGLIQVLSSRGDLVGAEGAARAWARAEPGSAMALAILANALHRNGKAEEAAGSGTPSSTAPRTAPTTCTSGRSCP